MNTEDMLSVKDVVGSAIESSASVSVKPTRCAELCFKMRDSVKHLLETLDVYYTVDGIQAVLRDKRDGQEYVLHIKPKSKEAFTSETASIE